MATTISSKENVLLGNTQPSQSLKTQTGNRDQETKCPNNKDKSRYQYLDLYIHINDRFLDVSITTQSVIAKAQKTKQPGCRHSLSSVLLDPKHQLQPLSPAHISYGTHRPSPHGLLPPTRCCISASNSAGLPLLKHSPCLPEN